MFLKDIEIRWDDLDANRHLANSSYLDYGSHTRFDFLADNGFDQRYMAKHQIGPIIFYEHVYYFKEVFMGKIQVSLGLKGMSENGMFFEFHHDFYDANGKNFAHSELMGAWLNLKTRSLTPLPEDMLVKFNAFPKDPEFKLLTKEDTRRFAKSPKDLDQRL